MRRGRLSEGAAAGERCASHSAQGKGRERGDDGLRGTHSRPSCAFVRRYLDASEKHKSRKQGGVLEAAAEFWRRPVVASSHSLRRVGPGPAVSPHRVATLPAARRLPGARLAPTSCRPWRPVGSASRLRSPESPVCKPQSPFGNGPSRPVAFPVGAVVFPVGTERRRVGTGRAASGSGERRVGRGESPFFRNCGLVSLQTSRGSLLSRPRCWALARCRNTIREATNREAPSGPRGLHVF